MSNETEYLSHFWWKEFYEVDQWKSERRAAFCRLCQMLNEEEEQRPRVWDHLGDWWSTGGHCKAKGSHTWSKYKPVVEGRWRR